MLHLARDRIGDARTELALEDPEGEVDARGHPAGGEQVAVVHHAVVAHVRARLAQLVAGARVRGGGPAPDDSRRREQHAAGAHTGDVPPAGAFEYLRTQAVSRLYLDNVPNIQSSWVTQGPKIGQLGLYFGANDMGSLMIEENVVSSAGTVHHLTLEQIKRAIREAGYIPRQRNVFYEYIDAVPTEEMAGLVAV